MSKVKYGKMLATYTQVSPELDPRTDRRMRTICAVESWDQGREWRYLGTIARSVSTELDYATVIQAQNNPNTLLAAFCNHVLDLEGRCVCYQISICGSDDGGEVWAFLAHAVQSKPPYAVWNPELRRSLNGEIQLYFSQEFDVDDQHIMCCVSMNRGVLWSKQFRIDPRKEHMRDGMCSIASSLDTVLNQEVLVMVIETTRFGGAAGLRFNLEAMLSYDDGQSWGWRQMVYNPGPSWIGPVEEEKMSEGESVVQAIDVQVEQEDVASYAPSSVGSSHGSETSSRRRAKEKASRFLSFFKGSKHGSKHQQIPDPLNQRRRSSGDDPSFSRNVATQNRSSAFADGSLPVEQRGRNERTSRSTTRSSMHGRSSVAASKPKSGVSLDTDATSRPDSGVAHATDPSNAIFSSPMSQGQSRRMSELATPARPEQTSRASPELASDDDDDETTLTPRPGVLPLNFSNSTLGSQKTSSEKSRGGVGRNLPLYLFSAGNPQLAVMPADKSLVCVFMTDEDHEPLPLTEWTDHASVKAIFAPAPQDRRVTWAPAPIQVTESEGYSPTVCAIDARRALITFDHDGPRTKILSWTKKEW